jgi:hypothetical protein
LKKKASIEEVSIEEVSTLLRMTLEEIEDATKRRRPCVEKSAN